MRIISIRNDYSLKDSRMSSRPPLSEQERAQIRALIKFLIIVLMAIVLASVTVGVIVTVLTPSVTTLDVTPAL